MAQQKVFRLPSKGAGYEAIKETSEPIPKISPHEVLVKIHATTLNFRDLVIADGRYPFPAKDNVVPLSDGAGTIAEVGADVAGLQKDDWVIANFDITNLYGTQKDWEHGLGGPIDGMLRQYAAIPASAIVKIPKTTKLSWSQLAGLVCTGTTAWNSLYGNIPLKPGQTVLFQGTGGVSMTGLMLAKAAGAITIITSSSDDKLKMAKDKYGVDYMINYKKTPDWDQEALKITDGRGVDFIIENGGSGTIAKSIECIARGGIISVVGFLDMAKEMPDVASLVLGKGCVVRGINVGAKQLTDDMVAFVCGKNLDMPVEKTFGFSRDEVLKAYKYLEGATHVGKISIEIK
jgi:NADPH:quinone reductase-like Zn-dependent oxidoreductase